MYIKWFPSVNFLSLLQLLSKLLLFPVFLEHVPEFVVRSRLLVIVFGLYFGLRDRHVHQLGLLVELSEVFWLLLPQLVQFLGDLNESYL